MDNLIESFKHKASTVVEHLELVGDDFRSHNIKLHKIGGFCIVAGTTLSIIGQNANSRLRATASGALLIGLGVGCWLYDDHLRHDVDTNELDTVDKINEFVPGIVTEKFVVDKPVKTDTDKPVASDTDTPVATDTDQIITSYKFRSDPLEPVNQSKKGAKKQTKKQKQKKKGRLDDPFESMDDITPMNAFTLLDLAKNRKQSNELIDEEARRDDSTSEDPLDGSDEECMRKLNIKVGDRQSFEYGGNRVYRPTRH